MNKIPIKKVLGIIFCLILFMGTVPSCSMDKSNSKTGIPVPKTSSQNVKSLEIHDYTESLMGNLKEKASAKETERLRSQVQKMLNAGSSSQEGGREQEKIHRELNRLTKKYYSNWSKAQDAWDESYDDQILEKSRMMQALKKEISSSDYLRLEETYNQWQAEENLEKIQGLKDTMEQLMEKYRDLDGVRIVEDLTDTATQTLAVFKREDDGTYTYQDARKRALEPLNLSDQNKYRKCIAALERILPPEAMENFDTVSIFTDGPYHTNAYVNPLDHKGSKWNISIDKEDMNHLEEFCYTAVHEYAHYLTLNSSQVSYLKEPSKKESKIYGNDSFKAKANADIQRYYEKYWVSFHDDRMLDTNSVLFYLRHHEEFVSSYAASDCAEDLAETFAWYVLDPQGAQGAVKEKMGFLDDQPRLKREKEMILEHLKKNGVIPAKYPTEYDDWKVIMEEK